MNRDDLKEIERITKEAINEAAAKAAAEAKEPRNYLTVEDWAEYIGISRPYAYDLVNRKDFPPVTIRIGRRMFIVRRLWDSHAEKLAQTRTAM